MDQENNKSEAEVTPAAPASPKPRAQNSAEKAHKPAQAMAQPVAPRIINRHDVVFRHDVFRSSNEKCVRNLSYRDKQPDLHKIDHAHVYHSHSNGGKKLTKTNSACGHWHNVEHYTDPRTGEIIAKCGPAMHEVSFMTSTGRMVNRVEPVSFDKEETSGERDGQIIKIVDDHTHTLNYLGSEELSPARINEGLKSQQAEAAAMGVVVGGIKDNTPAPMSPADGATIS